MTDANLTLIYRKILRLHRLLGDFGNFQDPIVLELQHPLAYFNEQKGAAANTLLMI